MVSTERVLVKMLSNETILNKAVLSKKGIYWAEGAVLESVSDISGKFRRFIKNGTFQDSKKGLVNSVNGVNRKQMDPHEGSIPVFGPWMGGGSFPFSKTGIGRWKTWIPLATFNQWPLCVAEGADKVKNSGVSTDYLLVPKRYKNWSFQLITIGQWSLFGAEKLKIEVFHSPLLVDDQFSAPKVSKVEKKLDFLLTTFSPWPLFGAEGAKKLKMEVYHWPI